MSIVKNHTHIWQIVKSVNWPDFMLPFREKKVGSEIWYLFFILFILFSAEDKTHMTRKTSI